MRTPLSLAIFSSLALAAVAAPRKFDLPVETGSYRPGPGVEMAQAFCMNCHSTEYCETQPPFPEKYWDATVKKMREKFAAPIPEEMIPTLVKYLTSQYGAATPPK